MICVSLGCMFPAHISLSQKLATSHSDIYCLQNRASLETFTEFHFFHQKSLQILHKYLITGWIMVYIYMEKYDQPLPSHQ